MLRRPNGFGCYGQRERTAFTLVETVVALAIIGVLTGLVLSGVQRVRASAARTQCQNNLRQVGIGLAGFHGVNGVFPPGLVVDTTSPSLFPYMSWHARILPFVEQDGVWAQAASAYQSGVTNFTQSPPHPLATVIRLYGCPADARVASPQLARGTTWVALTSYLGVSGDRTSRRTGCLFADSRVRVVDITDGSSNTLLAGERPPSVDAWYGWWYAGYGADGFGKGDMILGTADTGAGGDFIANACPDQPAGFVGGNVSTFCDAFHYWSLHPGGAYFAIADGSTRFLSYSAAPIVSALATRAGGETVELPE